MHNINYIYGVRRNGRDWTKYIDVVVEIKKCKTKFFLGINVKIKLYRCSCNSITMYNYFYPTLCNVDKDNNLTFLQYASSMIFNHKSF